MALTRADVVRYVYTAGVVASGFFLHRTVEGLEGPEIIVVIGLLAVGWTIYYDWSIEPRIERWERLEET